MTKDPITTCPSCGETLEATAWIYLSDVKLDPDTHEVLDYVTADHLGDRPDGVILHEGLQVYCRNSHKYLDNRET